MAVKACGCKNPISSTILQDRLWAGKKERRGAEQLRPWRGSRPPLLLRMQARGFAPAALLLLVNLLIPERFRCSYKSTPFLSQPFKNSLSTDKLELNEHP